MKWSDTAGSPHSHAPHRESEATKMFTERAATVPRAMPKRRAFRIPQTTAADVGALLALRVMPNLAP
ncbi:hypothetical protein GCM10010358_73870 [Streptomyces minutiscleroticus]|uniref:Uncharacterized protein n=1 Tax=Streptomyces minutiscleroticus TaxID=68238 RepID=A0A918NZV3_9ACTN|nr:hypothetical protein GCM10010358_73870 [Streptomyces minutiscleroticus]